MEMEQRVERLERQARTHRMVMAAQAAALAAVAVVPMALAGKERVGRFDRIEIGEKASGPHVIIAIDGLKISDGPGGNFTTLLSDNWTMGNAKATFKKAIQVTYLDEILGTGMTVEHAGVITSVGWSNKLAGLGVFATNMTGSGGQGGRLGWGVAGPDDLATPQMRLDFTVGDGVKRRVLRLVGDEAATPETHPGNVK